MAAKEHTPLPVLIARKRDGHELSEAQIEQFVSGVSTGSIPVRENTVHHLCRLCFVCSRCFTHS